MTNKIFDVVDSKLIIKPEALCISPFEEIWKSDKTESKKIATEKIKFIWFYSDTESPYYKNYPEDIRAKHIATDILKDKSYKISKDIIDGCSKYRELYTTPEERLVDGAQVAVYRMEKYYREVDLSEISETDIKRISDAVVALPKLVQAMKDARKAAQSEEGTGTKVRGQANLGIFE